LVFSDDWGRHPSSCQHLVGQLLGRYDVYWVNTIGTRKPRLDLATLRRGFEKIAQWLRPAPDPQTLPTGLRVLNPRMWPWIGSGFDRWLNRRLLLRQLTPVVKALPDPPTAVTTLPIVADLMDDLPVQRWVYYCVDDFSEWPGLDQESLRRMEERVIRRADRVIAVSETLQAKLAQTGRPAPLLTHGVDVPFWAVGGRRGAVPALDGLERPLIVFWGLIDQRMDVAWVRQLADELTAGTIVLLGRVENPHPELCRLPRVVRLAPLPYEQLPQLAREAAVLVMPYADLPVTRSMQPLKLKEYLATGKPTVVRDLPAVRPWADCLDLADTPETFVCAVQRRIEEGLPEDQRRARARLTEESWAAKAQAFERWALKEGAWADAACCS
jgi:glycosyltransferase involved in cell wall biosynthesis